MAQLCCNCLNVTVNVTADYKSQTRPTTSLFSSQKSSHPVLTKNKTLYEVQLDVAGIVVQLRPLVVKTVLEDWVLASCTNCGVLVYITHSIKMDRTLVTQNLLSSREAIQRVTEQPSFSNIFRILLQTHEELPESYSRKRVSSMSFGREDPEMKQLHQQMKSYLTQEEEAMEHRIRLFEKQQRQDFLNLQEKAHQQRRALFTAITKVRDNLGSEVKRSSTSPSSGDINKSRDLVGVTTPISSAGPSRDTSTSAQRQRSGSNSRQSERTSKATLTITLQDEIPLNIAQMTGEELEEDDGAMFSLDGFEMEEEKSRDTGFEEGGASYRVGDVAFPQSDDEEISTDDSSYRDLAAVTGPDLATSVPLEIPMYSKPPRSAVQPSSLGVMTRRLEGSRGAEGEAAGEGELEWGELGNCIRQLALSVQDTGMFGDLPRPRMYEK